MGSLRPRILNPRNSSKERNMQEMLEIVKKLGLKNMPDERKLNAVEDTLRASQAALFKRWSWYAGALPKDGKATTTDAFDVYDDEQAILDEAPKKGDPNETKRRRYTYRILGILDGREGEKSAGQFAMGLGPRDAWVVTSGTSTENLIGAFKHAYDRGINIIIDGELTAEQWQAINDASDDSVQAQATELLGRDGKFIGSIVPMFDLRLNGRNTRAKIGAFNAGSFKANPVGALLFYVETVLNEYAAGDAEFIRTRMTDQFRYKRDGVYELDAHKAFGNLFDRLQTGDTYVSKKYTPSEETKNGGGKSLHVFGDYSLTEYSVLAQVLESSPLFTDGNIKRVVVSDGTGVAEMAKQWAESHGIEVVVVPTVDDNNTGRVKSIMAQSDRAIGFWGRAHTGTSGEALNTRKHWVNAKKPIKVIYTTTGEVEVGGVLKKGGPVYRMGTAPLGGKSKSFLHDKGIAVVTVPTWEQLKSEVLDHLDNGTVQNINFDMGTTFAYEDQVTDQLFVEQVYRFRNRVGMDEEAFSKRGWLDSVAPNEIAAMVRTEVGGVAYYHPVRPYETANKSGAPAEINIQSIGFDDATGKIQVNWVYEGDMRGKSFKIFEDDNASVKMIARPDSVPDMLMQDGTQIAGMTARASTATRRMYMRNQQKMLTLIYKARMSPWGYNLGEIESMLIKEPELKQILVDGTPSYSVWADAVANRQIQFTDDAQMNNLLNYFASRCVNYGIDPTIFFASHHNGKPNYEWFNYQLVLKSDREFRSTFMSLMHLLTKDNPLGPICPDGLNDTSDRPTLFDRNLQVLRPVLREDGSIRGYERVDMFGGWHFLDTHVYGFHASGTNSKSYQVPALPAMMAGGKEVVGTMLKELLGWGGISRDIMDAVPTYIDPDTEDDF